MKKPIIEIKNLTKKFKGKLILDNINLKIYPGEIFGLLGPNGCGKTTLIHLLLGTIEPDEGEIKIFGKDLQKNLSEIHQKVNFASAYSHLQEQITIMENLRTFAGLYGVQNSKEKLNQLIKFFCLEKLVQQSAKTMNFSSGENTRLLLCKALINDPQILFLDEPTASLDPGIAKKVQDLILKVHRQRKLTIFYTSHNLVEVKKLCSRVGFLKKGRFVEIVPVKELKKLIKFY
jgi:ABC-2 type transport system ATP-binding protein